jgi:hypothetical protein
MTDVRAPEADRHPPDGVAPPGFVPVCPLRVSGLVVHRSDLVATLRAFVPALADIAVDEGGEHFWLLLGSSGAAAEDAS